MVIDFPLLANVVWLGLKLRSHSQPNGTFQLQSVVTLGSISMFYYAVLVIECWQSDSIITSSLNAARQQH